MSPGEAASPDPAATMAERMAMIAGEARRSNLARIERLDELLAPGFDADRRSAAVDVAHKLAGSAGTFGYGAVSDHARALETYLQQESDDAAADDAGEQQRVREWLGELRAGMAADPDLVD